jgi:phage gpG-like protein
MLTLTVKVNGRSILAKRHIRNLQMRATNLMPMWPRVGTYLSGVVRKQFASKGVYLQTPWKPLQPDYRLWKVKHGYSSAILVKTGDLKRSFGRPMQIESYRRDSASFGSREQTALWHQDGTRRHGRQVNPPRPILKATPLVKREVKKIVRDWIVEGR